MFAPGAGRLLVPVAAAAVGLILLGALVAGLGIVVWPGAAVLAAVGVFFAVFFRDPERAAGEGIVAPADGRVRAVTSEDGRLRVSVFMNVTNVHVNRLPMDATVETVSTSGHGFRPAYRDEARHNVQRSYRLSTSLGEVEVVQMTGIVARRLVSFVRPGDQRPKGSRFGMIVLGSRVDLLLPADRVEPAVATGARVRAGITTVAREKR